MSLFIIFNITNLHSASIFTLVFMLFHCLFGSASPVVSPIDLYIYLLGMAHVYRQGTRPIRQDGNKVIECYERAFQHVNTVKDEMTIYGCKCHYPKC